MVELLNFHLTARYKSPSKEDTFLGKGWGLRDVRGPYLVGHVGSLHIASAVLSVETPSTISMVLSMSNRCPTPSVLVKVSSFNKEVREEIRRNDSTDFVFDSVYARPMQAINFNIQLINLDASKRIEEFSDILAIDELTIERFR